MGADQPADQQTILAENIRLKARVRDLEAREARFRASLYSIGDGMIATDAEGRVLQMNLAAEPLTGWSETESRERPIHEILRLVDAQTRRRAENPVLKVLEGGAVVGLSRNTLLVSKDGREIPIAGSGSPIQNDAGEITGVVLVFRDHTEERLTRRFIETRLSLIEYAADHTLDELLTHALDEVGAFVDSPIGFYHFVEPNQKTLSLQQWSTRTLTEFCQAEAKSIHYPVDQAGVWVDCIHQKKPVIHNDYASLPHRKGMPEGHALVIRELVVPVMRDGRVVAILGVGNKPVDYTRKDVEIVSYLADVTWEIVRQKQAEEAIRANENLLDKVLDVLPVGLWLADGDGRLLRNNKAARRIWGGEALPSQEEYGKFKARRLPSGEPVAADDWALLHTLRGGRPILNELLEIDAFDGVTRTILNSTAPVMDDQGHLQAALVVNWDVTERRRIEAEREQFMAAIEQAGEMFLITDPDGVIQYVNPAFERVTGYSRGEAIGRKTSLLKSGFHDDAFYRGLWETISGGGIFQGRIVNQRKDGNRFTEEATISAVMDTSGRIVNYVAIKRDITEDLKLEERLRQAQKMDAIGRLAGGVAHDYSNTLSAVLGFAELALEKTATGEPLEEDLQEVIQAAKLSRNITRQLLAFARKDTIAPVVLDVNTTIESLLKMLRRLMGEDIELEWLPGRDLWPVKVDPSQIDQLLANLCINARDAITDVGRVTIQSDTIHFDEADRSDQPWFIPGDYVMVTVSDDGRGMDKATMDKVFEPFFTTKPSGRGTGLGLATVYGIVKQNGGFINVYSEPRKGTTFKIYLPAHAGRVTQVEKAAAAVLPKGRGETVLVVEDDPAILKLAARVLDALGYRVLKAGSPADALELAQTQTHGIDLLLTDVIMPGMNGRELAERMRSLHPQIRCLFMSGYTANVIANRGILDDGVNLIQKPFMKKDLAVKVRRALDGQ